MVLWSYILFAAMIQEGGGYPVTGCDPEKDVCPWGAPSSVYSKKYPDSIPGTIVKVEVSGGESVKSQILDIKIGNSAQFNLLTLHAKFCSRDKTDANLVYAYFDISNNGSSVDAEFPDTSVYSGWILSSDDTQIQRIHPDYTISVLECKS